MFSDGRARLSGDINRLIDGNLRIKPREMSERMCEFQPDHHCVWVQMGLHF